MVAGAAIFRKTTPCTVESPANAANFEPFWPVFLDLER
jgi:hypothetical protein